MHEGDPVMALRHALGGVLLSMFKLVGLSRSVDLAPGMFAARLSLLLGL